MKTSRDLPQTQRLLRFFALIALVGVMLLLLAPLAAITIHGPLGVALLVCQSVMGVWLLVVGLVLWVRGRRSLARWRAQRDLR